jgi:hypothetical protein
MTDVCTVKLLAAETGMTEKSIRQNMTRGVFLEGIHYFRPRARRVYFSRRAIEEWAKGLSKHPV